MGKKGNLKGALLSQQSRLKQNAKAKESAQRAQKQSAALDRGDSSKQLSRSQAASSTNGTYPRNAKDLKGKARAQDTRPRKVTIPFQPTDTILLIGEGNFSFALALTSFSQTHPTSISESPSPLTSNSSSPTRPRPHPLQHLPPSNITATAYDSEEACYEKYPEASGIVAQLRERGVEVLFRVDATQLEKYKALKGRMWDRVAWNFPHAGKGITDQDRNILANQNLLLGFLRSASHFLKQGPIPIVQAKSRKRKRSNDDDDDDEGNANDPKDATGNDSDDEGEIHLDSTLSRSGSRGTLLITLRNVEPYTSWNLPSLAKHPPLQRSTPQNPSYVQLRSFVFHRDAWPGYEHRMTKGERAHGTGTTGVGGEDRTWEFCLKD